MKCGATADHRCLVMMSSHIWGVISLSVNTSSRISLRALSKSSFCNSREKRKIKPIKNFKRRMTPTQRLRFPLSRTPSTFMVTVYMNGKAGETWRTRQLSEWPRVLILFLDWSVRFGKLSGISTTICRDLPKRHRNIIIVWVENKPGSLNKVNALFTMFHHCHPVGFSRLCGGNTNKWI